MRRLVAVAATIGAAVMFPSAALAWSSPIQVSPTVATGNTQATGAELQDNGVLRVWWSPNYGARRSGVSLVTSNGRVRITRAAALDRYTEEPANVNPAYAEPVFLPDGRAVRCAVTESHRAPFRAAVHVLVYSRTGAIIKRVFVVDQPEDISGEDAPTCEMSAAGSHVVVLFTQETASSGRYNGARQIYVARLLPGLKVSNPVAVLAAGTDQQTLVPGDPNSYAQASVSPTGWIAVLWPWANITKETSKAVAQHWQFRMTWISPSGTVGPIIPLGPVHGGGLCADQSPACGLTPPVPGIATVGPQRALVVFGWPRLSSEEVDSSGRFSPSVTAYGHAAFADPEFNAVASGGGTVVVTWGGGYVTHTRCAPIYAQRWRRGHWGKPTVVARPYGKTCAYNPQAYVNQRGQAALVWWRGTSPIYPTGYSQATFDF